MVVVRPDEGHQEVAGQTGLSSAEARDRLLRDGPNAVRSHHARPLAVLGRQLRSPLLALLAVTAAVSFFVGQRTDAVIIGVILFLSVALGFVNEYRAERAAEAGWPTWPNAPRSWAASWSSAQPTGAAPSSTGRCR